jgi:hypothetical protein
MIIYINFELCIYFSFCLAVLQGDLHSSAVCFIPDDGKVQIKIQNIKLARIIRSHDCDVECVCPVSKVSNYSVY